MWDCSKFSRATGPFFLDPALTSRHSDLLGVKRSVWASMSERPQALSGIVIPLATHSFPSELMTTKSGLCKPIKVDKKHRLCVSNPLIAHKRENHIECICLVGHLEGVSVWKFDLYGLKQSTVTFLLMCHACSYAQLGCAYKPPQILFRLKVWSCETDRAGSL